MRPGTATALGEDVLEVDLAVEAEASIWQDVDPVTLVVCRGVHNGYLLIY